MKRKAPPSPAEVLRLRLELQYVEPLIWREVDVISSTRLDELHYVIQVVMGWEDDHLWAFQAGERRFERPHEEPSVCGDLTEDASAISIETVLSGRGRRVLYNYDFGDDWLVAITMVSAGPLEQSVHHPRCVAGERAGPLEDSGGPPGYERLLEVRKKPRSREAKALLEWAGEDWDPGAFDIQAANKELARLLAPRRLQ